MHTSTRKVSAAQGAAPEIEVGDVSRPQTMATFMNPTEPSLAVEHRADSSRFELHLDDVLVGMVGYVWERHLDNEPCTNGSDVVAFLHTIVEPDHMHRGLAAVLVCDALETARNLGWSVRPVCSYVRSFIANGQGAYDSLLAAHEPQHRRRHDRICRNNAGRTTTGSDCETSRKARSTCTNF